MSDTTDDMEHDAALYEASLESRGDDWYQGLHTTREGVEMKLSEMTTDHLENTIRYFKRIDTSPLEEELKRRLESLTKK